MWVLESAHRLSRSLFFGGEEDPASSATGATGGVQEVPEQQQGHGEHGETHGPQHPDEHSTQQEAVLGPQPEQAREHPEEHVIQRGQETARDAQLEAKEPAREPDQERVEEPAAGLVPGQEQLQAPSDLRGVSARERVLGGEGRGPAASSDSPFDEVPLSEDQDAVATGQAHPEGSLQCQSRTLPDTPVGSDGSPIAHSSHRERGESQPPEGAAGRTRSGIALQSDGTDGPDTRRQVAHLLWPPVPPPPPPPPPSPPPPPPPSSARPSVSAMTWPPAAGSSEDADEAEQGTSTRYATDGSDDERDERATDADSEGGSESGGGGLDGGGPEDILDGGREDTLLPPRRAGVGTSRVSALRQVLLAQASPFALRAAMWRGPEVEPLLDQSARQGLGEGPNADADNRTVRAQARVTSCPSPVTSFRTARVAARGRGSAKGRTLMRTTGPTRRCRSTAPSRRENATRSSSRTSRPSWARRGIPSRWSPRSP